MGVLDDLRRFLGGGDPEATGMAYASSQPSPDLLQYAQDMLSGKIAAGGALGQNYYDPNRSFAANALDPRAIEQAIEVAGGIGPGAIRAYHGSPHSFDRFDISKIGTGEGAQAYGHGLYFAEAEPVAKGYRDALSATKPQQLLSPTGETVATFPNSGVLYGKRHDLADEFFPPNRDNPMDWMRTSLVGAWLDNSLKPPTSENILQKAFGGSRGFLDDKVFAEADRLAALGQERLQGYTFKQPGHMYEVDIHADPKALLDWDRPLAAQPDVQRVLAEAKIINPRSEFSEVLARANQQTGGEIYESSKLVPGGYRDPPAASAALRELGIPGIRYLDQGSRVRPSDLQRWQEATKHWEDVLKQFPNEKSVRKIYAQVSGKLAELEKQISQGTSNYAIFDPSIIEILRKYGILPPAVAAGGLLGTGSEPPT